MASNGFNAMNTQGFGFPPPTLPKAWTNPQTRETPGFGDNTFPWTREGNSPVHVPNSLGSLIQRAIERDHPRPDLGMA